MPFPPHYDMEEALLSVLANATIRTLLRRIVTFFVPAWPGTQAWAALVLLSRTSPGRGGPTMEIVPIPTPFSPSALAHLQASFLAIVLPRVLSHSRVCFRGIKCPHGKEDALQEMIGLAMTPVPGREGQGRHLLPHRSGLLCCPRREKRPQRLPPAEGQRGPVAPGQASSRLRRRQTSRFRNAFGQAAG